MPASNRRTTMGKCIVKFLNEDEYYRRIKSCGFTIPLRVLHPSDSHKEEKPKDPSADRKEPAPD